MFKKPVAGWTEWEINGHNVGRVSYLSDVPRELIEACVSYIHNPGAFNLYFDAEGYDVGLVQIGDRFYLYSDYKKLCLEDVSGYLVEEEDAINFVKSVLKEAIADFERDFDLWVLWNPYDTENAEEIMMERESLKNLIKKGKSALKHENHQMELGNLLFGNSRGENPVNRHPIQEIWYEMFKDVLDDYGYLANENLSEHETERGGFENDTFIVNPYYWGEDEEIAQEHNFIYKPENIYIDWYKYPMRDAYSNIELTEEKAREIFKVCVESVKEKDK